MAGDGAAAAKGRDGAANALSKGDEEIVDLLPVPSGEDFAKPHLGLLGVLGLEVAPAVRDPVDMDVDANPVAVMAQGEDQVGRLSADALEREEGLEVLGHFPVVVLEESSGDVPEGPSLLSIEPDGENQALYLARAQAEHFLGSVSGFEEPSGRCFGGFIFRAQAQEGGREDKKWVAASSDLSDAGLFKRPVLSSNLAKDRGDRKGLSQQSP